MKVLICPDKFKGSLTADEVVTSVEQGLLRFDPKIEVIKLPLADGGDGTLDVLEANLNVERIYLQVSDPLGRPIETYYIKNRDTAFIEMAKSSGLQLLSEDERNPLKTSTYGVGQMIRHAIEGGVSNVYLLVGGSATNDAGIGMASALGYEFFDEDGLSCSISGAGLNVIRSISRERVMPLISSVSFTVLTDVQNLLLGPEGATRTYCGQKGGDLESIECLEDGMVNLTDVLNNGNENIHGAGAAGGLGYGALTFLNAKLESGIHTIMDLVCFEQFLEDVDLIITGEGKLDDQTGQGKVVWGVVERVKDKNIPIGIICGDCTKQLNWLEAFSIEKVMAIARNKADAMKNADKYVEELAFRIVSGL